MSKMIPWLLLMSVLANGFMAGILFNRHPGPPPHLRREAVIEQMLGVLSPPDAEILRQAAAAEPPSKGPPPPWEMDEFRAKVASLMMAEPFDEAAFRTLFEEFRRNREQMLEGLGNILIRALPQMSAEGRRRLAQIRPQEHMPPPERN